MLINRNTQIIGQKCILVPYRKEHVAKYHNWMKSEELQKLTASEPLTLDEEYDMQKSWLTDESKCTFIVLDKEIYERTSDEIESMIGDTNLFFANSDDRLSAEAEIMIAEEIARGRKCGTEAMLLMFLYAIETLCVREFVVKIIIDNEISLKMFEQFGFTEISRSEVFQQITLCKIVNPTWIEYLKSTVGRYDIKIIEK